MLLFILKKPIYDIPAHPKILGAGLIENLKEQADPFNPVYHLNQKVIEINALGSSGQQWEVKTSTGTVIQTQCILIAAGVGAFGPNRPPLSNIEDFEDKSVYYYVRSPQNFKGKRVVIAGGGDSAIDWAITLSDIGALVTVVHRRAKFKAAPESEKRLKSLVEEGKIDLIIPYQLYGLKGESGYLTAVTVQKLDGETKEIQADFLLPFYGLSMNLGPIAEWGLGLSHSHITIDPLTGATSRPGIYAIGDIATYPHKLKLILTGFSEAAQAAHAMRRFLHPDEVVHFGILHNQRPSKRNFSLN